MEQNLVIGVSSHTEAKPEKNTKQNKWGNVKAVK